jgi:hypothetical protein
MSYPLNINIKEVKGQKNLCYLSILENKIELFSFLFADAGEENTILHMDT